METLRLAIQKSGRLSEKSLDLLRQCGIQVANGERKLLATASNFPLELLFLRDDDIPQYVEQQVADLGMLGLNEVMEQGKNVTVCDELGFASCRLSLAVPKEAQYSGPSFFQGKKVATSYPNILKAFFARHQVGAEIEQISGSVEIAPGIGLADGICDLVSTGSTLITNGLKEVETVLKSQAVLIAHPRLSEEKTALLEQLRFRLHAVQRAGSYKYILLNAPNEALPHIQRILPAMKSPTLLPLALQGWSSLHSVIREDDFWEVIGQLKQAGAEGILIIPIEKMIQ